MYFRIFAAYVHMEPTVQEAMQDLLAPLIRSLGPTNAKLLLLIKTFEPGAESLILRIIKILTENGRPNANLVALVKELIAERDLDARFLMPIIGEMDKVRGSDVASTRGADRSALLLSA
jgi:symplekin